MKHPFSQHAFKSAIATLIVLSGILTLNSAANAACLDQVPTLSSTSSRVSTSGDLAASYAGWKAFDGTGSMWLSETWETPAWIGYNFDAAKKVDRYTIRYTNGSITSRAPKNFELRGYNGSTWTTVDTRTNQVNWQGSETRSYSVANPGYYTQYRLHVTDDNDSRSGIVVLSIGELTLEICSTEASLSCSPAGNEATLCSYSGDYASGMTFYWNSNRYFPIVYPSSGSFPYNTTNGSIVFLHEGYSSCPSGTSISLSTSLSGYATFTCQ